MHIEARDSAINAHVNFEFIALVYARISLQLQLQLQLQRHTSLDQPPPSPPRLLYGTAVI